MSGINIDIGHLIWAKIVKISTTIATGLWFPSLITMLCCQTGVVIDLGEYYMWPLLPIERVSKTRYTYQHNVQQLVQLMEWVFRQPSPPNGHLDVA